MSLKIIFLIILVIIIVIFLLLFFVPPTKNIARNYIFCTRAGEMIYSDGSLKGSKVCCPGLVEISEDLGYFGPNCDKVGPPGGWAVICSSCGNGKCEKWETHCNCPKDCK